MLFVIYYNYTSITDYGITHLYYNFMINNFINFIENVDIGKAKQRSYLHLLEHLEARQ